MKAGNTIITVVAIIVLAGVGYYLWNQGKELEPREETQPEYTETIDGEDIELDHPYVESFSNAESNAKTNETTANNWQAPSQHTNGEDSLGNQIARFRSPFMFGIYYLGNFKDIGVDHCRMASEETEDDIDFPHYTKDNFRLTDIEFKEKNAFLFVDADELPQGLCAKIIQFDNISTRIFDALHVIVE